MSEASAVSEADTPIQMRRAVQADLPRIVGLLADDPLGSAREVLSDDTVHLSYVNAFAAIDADPNQLMAVAVSGEQVVGCLQISFVPGLSRRGMWRGQLESIRVAQSSRGQGVGEVMVRWAIDICRERGCGLVQLTSDNSRIGAIRFYQSLGFVATHQGMKLPLSQ